MALAHDLVLRNTNLQTHPQAAHWRQALAEAPSPQMAPVDIKLTKTNWYNDFKKDFELKACPGGGDGRDWFCTIWWWVVSSSPGLDSCPQHYTISKYRNKLKIKSGNLYP